MRPFSRQPSPLRAAWRLASFALFAVLGLLEGAESVFAVDCRRVVRPESAYTVCSVDPARETIRVYAADPGGEPYGSFDRLARQLWDARQILVFAVNGGMFRDDYGPVGLLVENGAEKGALSTRGGWGNFHLLPNGVFYMKDGKPGILETRQFQARRVRADYATQSGPMLVIDGALHPKFKPDSDSWKRRNGVGIDRNGQVHFAISQGPVRFYDFAELFRAELDCHDALYLDGTISSQYFPTQKRNDRLFPLGPVIGVAEPIPQLTAGGVEAARTNSE